MAIGKDFQGVSFGAGNEGRESDSLSTEPLPTVCEKVAEGGGEEEVSVRFRFNGKNGPLVRSSQMAAEEFSYWKKWDPRSAPLKKALGPSQNFLCMRPTNNFIFAACCNQAFLPIPLLALPAAASFAGETKEKQTKKRERFFFAILPPRAASFNFWTKVSPSVSLSLFSFRTEGRGTGSEE